MINFLMNENAGICEIHHRMSTVYGEYCVFTPEMVARIGDLTDKSQMRKFYCDRY